MFKLLIGLSWCLLGADRADTSTRKAEGFEPAQAVRRQTRKVEGRIVTERCDTYPHFAVVSTHDGDDMGDVLEVRPACEAPTTKPLEAETGSLLGVVGPYVLVRAADDFGVLAGVQAFEASSGRRVLDDEMNVSLPFRVARQGETVTLRFQRRLHLDCDPRADRGCWQRTLGKANVPRAVAWKAPRCPAPDASLAHIEPDRVFQLTVPVEIALTAGTSKVSFLAGTATCDLTP